MLDFILDIPLLKECVLWNQMKLSALDPNKGLKLKKWPYVANL